MNTFVTFQRFNSLERAKELVEVLEQNGIEYDVEDTTPEAVLTSSDAVQKEFRVKLLQRDFERVNSILQSQAAEALGETDKDHYLFGFTEEELMEVIEKPDEWSAHDQLLARELLKKKGREISPEEIEEYRRQRLKVLAKPEGGQGRWIFWGYLFALTGGLIGIFIGWHLLSFKKTLPDGNKVYAYDTPSRVQGQRILALGVVSFILFTAWKIWKYQRI